MANAKVTADATWYGGASVADLAIVDGIVDNLLLRTAIDKMLPFGCGNIFYVNGGSDGPVVDTGNGLTPTTAKRFLQSGIDLCTTNHDDVVVVLNYGGNARAAEVFPVTLTKDRVHILGVGTVSNRWPVVSVLTPAGGDIDDPAILVTGQRCEIAGIEFGGGNTAGCIEVGSLGGVWGCWIHDCWFGVTGDSVGQDGINVPATFDAPYLTVTGCRFGASITRDGIRFDGNATRCMIGQAGQLPNVFYNIAGIAINVAAAVTSPSIHNNIISVVSDTGGKGITLGAAVAGATVHGNFANFGDADMAANPFADGAAGDANTWILNYKGITAIMPS